MPQPTFDEIYAATFVPVCRWAHRLGVPHSAIDDVAQDVFVAVHRQLEHFGGHCKQETWVLAILTRVVSNYHRTRRRKGAGHATSSDVDDPETIADTRDPEELMSQREAGRIVRTLLAELKGSQATIFVMAELEGMTAFEIALATNSNLNTVNSRLRAARTKLTRLIDQFQSPAQLAARRSKKPASRVLAPWRASSAGVAFSARLAMG